MKVLLLASWPELPCMMRAGTGWLREILPKAQAVAYHGSRGPWFAEDSMADTSTAKRFSCARTKVQEIQRRNP